MTDDAFPDALPNKSRLHWYVIERVLGQGGFGITYLARDTNLDRLVAIKEYLPADVAQRRADSTVRPRSETHAERYRWGLERFVGEAKTLAHFDHPNIVRVYAVFEANDTAYMVMRFEDGDNLAHLLEQRGTLAEQDLLKILLPILDGLQLVHNANFIHRDIKPENIHIRHDGSPVLLDFGSARQSLNRTHTMTVLVARGYAPLEQYYGDSETQGPWTDIYSLAATCYRAIAGSAPADALERIKGVLGSVREVLSPATAVGRGRYSNRLLKAIDHALEMSAKDRPQSIVEWRRALIEDTVAEPPAVSPPPPPIATSPPLAAEPLPVKTQTHALGQQNRQAQILWAVGGAAVAAVAIAIFASFQVQRSSENQSQANQQLLEAQRIQQEARKSGEERARRAEEERQRLAQQEAQQRATLAQPEQRVPPKPASAAVSKSKVPPDEPKLRDDKVQLADPLAAAPQKEIVLVAPPPVAKQPEVVAKLPQPEAPAKPAASDLLDQSEAALIRGDYATALPVIKRFASAGDPRGQALMGSLYENGFGIPRNAVDAYMWYSLSMRSGNSAARGMKERVAGKLQPAEIRQADRAVDRWRPGGEQGGGETR
jgi:serine/threonine protein kinase